MKRKSRAKRSRGASPLADAGILSKLFELSPAKMAVGTMDGTLVDVNLAYAEFLGYRREEMRGKSLADMGIISAEELRRLLRIGRAAGPAMRDVEITMKTRGGELVHVLLSANVVSLDGVLYRVATLTDVTARKRAEEERNALQTQLWRSQKMESVGRLAGGIAHDFNNMLTVINASTAFVLADLPKDDQKTADLMEILSTSQRAARLTRQLLAFSRKQVLNPQIMDLNAAVEGMANMLKRLIGENIALETTLTPEPCHIKADPGQIEQVLLNLAVNARDAMPEGGTLAFETSVARPGDEFFARHPDLRRGPMVSLTARDTGCGMTETVLARAFEPFFTTKGRGKGTGLGLSMVYGVIKQSGGDIEIESAPGQGTTFRIHLPRVSAAARGQDAELKKDRGAELRGRESILLVEDEEALRRLGQRVLAASGYTVLSAADGAEALRTLERHGKPVDLLITDVVMPGISGRELARAVARKKLARRTLFVSGYTDGAIARDAGQEPGLAFLGKPFTLDTLLRRVREVLDGPAGSARP